MIKTKTKPATRVKKLTRGERNIRWIETYCRIPEGKYVGNRVTLTDEQKSWVKMIYDTPTRTFILSMGRKNAKTAFSAFLLLLHLCGPEARLNSQLYSTAQSRDQAAILFNLAAKIVRLSPDLQSIIHVKNTTKQLLCKELGTAYRALSADASTAFGLSPVFVVHDELGQTRGPRSELYEALETASAAQEEPLSVVISTQAPTDADLLSLIIDSAKTKADPKVKLILYSADPEVDPFTEEAVRLANPHYDQFMNKEEVMRMAEEAKRMPSREPSFRNLILNQRVEAKSPFVSRDIWMRNGDTQLSESMDGRKVWGGLDLSTVNDLTAAVFLSPNPDETFDTFSTFWLPEEGLVEKSRVDRVPYDLWAEQKYLCTVPGNVIEYRWVASYLRGVFDRCEVQAIAFDRYNMKFLKPWLVVEGFSDEDLEKFIDFGQGFVSMSPALRRLEELLLGRKLRHAKHPVLTMCAANAVVVKDAAENRKFTKAKATGRIDGMVALAMAGSVASTHTDDADFDSFIANPVSLNAR